MDVNAKVIPFELHPLGLIEVFTRFGAGIKPLLLDTGIPPSFVDRAGVHISWLQQRQLIRNALRLCRTPGLGLLAGLQMDWSYYGAVGSVVNCSPSLQDAAAAMRRFLPVAQPHYSYLSHQPNLYAEQQGLLVTLLLPLPTVSEQPELALFEKEFRLAAMLRLYDQCGNKSVPRPQVRLQLDYPEPAHANLYQTLPCHHVNFGATRAAITCHYRFLTTPWRELRAPIYRRIIQQCEEELSQSSLRQTFAAKVRWHISQYYNRPVALEQIARCLGLSSRMLTRRLASEGTSFRQLVHEQRMELTALHLRASSLSVESVAELMGFSNPSSLRRAIKNWSGQAAGQLRGTAVAAGIRPLAEPPRPAVAP